MVCTTTAAVSAPARSPYDGSWTVLIVTEHGNCDRAFRYGIQIVDGCVRYDGTAVAFAGRSFNGNVRVTVRTAAAVQTAGRPGQVAGLFGGDIARYGRPSGVEPRQIGSLRIVAPTQRGPRSNQAIAGWARLPTDIAYILACRMD